MLYLIDNKIRKEDLTMNTDKITGKAKETVGDIQGDKRKSAEGKFDQVVGKAKDLAKDAESKVHEAVEDVKDKFDKK